MKYIKLNSLFKITININDTTNEIKVIDLTLEFIIIIFDLYKDSNFNIFALDKSLV